MAVNFKDAHFPPDVILMGILWYLTFCKQWGYRSIATASTDTKLALAHELGADETINYAAHDFEA